MNTEGTASMFVSFGTRAFSCYVERSEISFLLGHAIDLANAAHSLQRMMSRLDWSDDGEFDGNDCRHAGVGLDFLTGMIAKMLEIGGVA